MRPFVSDEINKKISEGVYFIEWYYDEIDRPEEILFWINYSYGILDLEFLGISQNSQMNKNILYFNFDPNTGLNIEKHSYKLSEKL